MTYRLDINILLRMLTSEIIAHRLGDGRAEKALSIKRHIYKYSEISHAVPTSQSVT